MNQSCYVALAGDVCVARGRNRSATFRAAVAVLMSAYELTPPGVHLDRIQVLVKKAPAVVCDHAPASVEEAFEAARAAMRVLTSHPGVMTGGTVH